MWAVFKRSSDSVVESSTFTGVCVRRARSGADRICWVVKGLGLARAPEALRSGSVQFNVGCHADLLRVARSGPVSNLDPLDPQLHSQTQLSQANFLLICIGWSGMDRCPTWTHSEACLGVRRRDFSWLHAGASNLATQVFGLFAFWSNTKSNRGKQEQQIIWSIDLCASNDDSIRSAHVR